MIEGTLVRASRESRERRERAKRVAALVAKARVAIESADGLSRQAVIGRTELALAALDLLADAVSLLNSGEVQP